jgi:DNA-binding protein HU-beta
VEAEMTKVELVEKMAKEAGISKADAGKVLSAFINEVTKTVKKGNKVTLVGFGTFSLAKRKARTGRNPRTGETIKIPASKIPKFSAGAGLKKAVK